MRRRNDAALFEPRPNQGDSKPSASSGSVTTSVLSMALSLAALGSVCGACTATVTVVETVDGGVALFTVAETWKVS